MHDPVHGPEPEDAGSRRGRLLLAAGLGAALVLAVVLVAVLGSSGEDRKFSAAPPQCIDRWNADQAAVAFGQHQSGSHGYYEVQVLSLSNDGASEVAAGDPGASCAVVFAATALDPEPVSAAQIEKRGAWIPLSQLVEFNRLAALQSEAQSAYNAQLTPEGTIQSL